MSDFELDQSALGGQPRQQHHQQQEPLEREQPRTERSNNNDDWTGLKLGDMAQQQYRAQVGGISDAALQTMQSVFESVRDHESPTLPDAIKRNQFRLIPMNSHISGGNPVMLVTLPLNNVDRINKTFVYVLVFEQNSTQQTTPRTWNREQYDGLVLPEDMLNQRFVKRLETQLDSGNEITIVNSQVITHELTHALTVANEADGQAVKIVASILNNAIDALSYQRDMLIARMNGRSSVDVALCPQAVDNGGRIEVQYEYPTVQKQDTSGLPIRADIAANVKYSLPTRDEWDQTQHERFPLGTVSAAIDLYLDFDQAKGLGSRFGKMVEDVPFWTPVLDITSIGGDSVAPHSMEHALYLIAQMALQTNDYRWARALRPKVVNKLEKGSLEPLIDLGWMNFYNPNEELAGYVDGISVNITDEQLGDFLTTVVNPEVAIGMTVGSSSEKSWTTALFEEIAKCDNKNERQRLISSLYTAANTLTDGIFSDYVDENTDLKDPNYSPVIYSGSSELIGVWVDDNANIRSLSEWNVLALASQLGDRNEAKELVYEYQRTFVDTERTTDYNLAVRYDILRRSVCPTARVIGTAPKLILDPLFVETLSRAISRTSLDPVSSNIDTLTRGYTNTRTRYGNYAASNLGYSQRREDQIGGRNHRGFFGNIYRR